MGANMVRRLLAGSDVFTTNLVSRRRQRYGLTYDEVAALNPRLVYLAFSGYGEEGPERDRLGFDFTAFWARSGMLEAMTEPGSPPPSPPGSTGDHATAEDLAQEVFLRVYRAREGYRPTAKFSTWVHTIANNVASDLRQRSYRRREHGVPTSASVSSSAIGLDQMAVAASGLMPARVADRSELRAVVQEAIAIFGVFPHLAPLIEARDVRAGYDAMEVLHGVSIEVGPAEMVTLIGPNGAGKSTTFNMVNGQLRADSGSIRLNGAELVGLKPREIWKLGVGRTFQIAETFSSLSVQENVQMALIARHGRVWRFIRPARALFRDQAEALLAAEAAGVQPEANVAVTGTNGKTSTVDFVRQLAMANRIAAASIGTLGTTAGVEMISAGRLYADDTNANSADGYTVFNLKASHAWQAGKGRVTVYARVDNLTDQKYVGSVIVNQSSSQFYEPASGVNYTVGLSLMAPL